jgi:hypothetical protein
VFPRRFLALVKSKIFEGQVKMVFCGVAVLFLLFIFSVPVTDAQLQFDGVAQVKGKLVLNDSLIM